ncbi:hypothetical protein A3D68_01100 [Candidatus Adlerbacteria bacterium RIFCSPHIGHO2_02_FULL_52_17]|uniref:Uncharacterized protein n=2 Tax=Patescibacteria group TaxID=1783273 RepID=A0A1F4XNN0_9BACT|nr:MAG: hypothetical protein A3D68_01100 [Candidatus Adlerbacteria bacterium RIFCSPHIGHO2_02_FULL_52_17]OGG18905.1 MAG: hypothetical protein A2721_03445 [Candidatus Gottesmanbacteria bacterium RIFCSPHIGHO2_01_FULL_47_48]
MKNKLLGVAGVIFILIAVFAVFYITNSKKEPLVAGFKCPEEYASREEYINGMALWSAVYLQNHPEASHEAVLDERQRLFDERRCLGWEEAAWNEGTSTEESASSDRINSLYFYSYAYEDVNGAYAIECPQTKEIDWQLAIYALSAYMQFEAPEEEHGPAEIQRNFDENCERNMHIYETLGPRISN